MKKLTAILLAVCLILGLAACADTNDGITLRNDLGCGIEEIYMTPAGADSWGEAVTGYVDPGVGAYLYPLELFGSSKLSVDIQIVDEFDNGYVFSDIPIVDGEGYYVKVDAEGDVLLINEEDQDLHIGQIDPGDPYVLLTNDLDQDIAELQIYLSDGSAGISIYTVDSGDEYQLSMTDNFSSPKALVDIYLLDEYGDTYRFDPISLRQGIEYTFEYDELDNPVLVDESTGSEYDSDLQPGGPSDRTLSDLEGAWEFSTENVYILFYGDLTWEMASFEGDLLGSGDYDFLGREVVVHTEGGSSTFRWDADGDLCCEEEELRIYYAFDFESQEYQQLCAAVQSKLS